MDSVTSVRNASLPPDHEIAKRLFSGSPESSSPEDNGLVDSSPRRRDPLRGYNGHGGAWSSQKRSRRKPRMGFCGAMIFLSLCLAAVALTVQFNTGEWASVTTEGM